MARWPGTHLWSLFLARGYSCIQPSLYSVMIGVHEQKTAQFVSVLTEQLFLDYPVRATRFPAHRTGSEIFKHSLRNRYLLQIKFKKGILGRGSNGDNSGDRSVRVLGRFLLLLLG